MSATPTLLRDRESILSSPLIQITHIHPGNAHRIRSDLDQEDLVVDNFPIAIAKAVLGKDWFEPPPLPSKVLKRKRSRNYSPPRRADSTPGCSTDIITHVPVPATLVKASISLRGGDVLSGSATPEKQLLPPIELEPDVADTVLTCRTVTPGGSEFSPLKKSQSELSPRSPLALLKNTNSIPTALFSPPRAPSSKGRGRVRGRGRGRGIHIVYKPRNPPPMVVYDSQPRPVDGSNPKATVVLRYALSLQGLKDVFMWTKHCVEECKIVNLEACLLTFHDWNRVEDIKEVCMKIGLAQFKTVCDEMLRKWRYHLMKNEGRKTTTQGPLTQSDRERSADSVAKDQDGSLGL